MYDASIVIPIYNQFKSLKIVLNAFNMQSYPTNQFEIIIVDDGSTDDLKNIRSINEFISGMSIHCRLIHTAKCGRSAARNTGIANADSNIIIFNDADRIPEKDFIKKHLYRQYKHDVVIGNSKNIWLDVSKIFLPIDNKNKYIRESSYYSKIKSSFEDDTFYLTYRWLTLLIGNSSIKKDLILQVGGFDESIIEWGLEHFDLGIRLQLQNVHFIIANEIENYHIYHKRDQYQALKNGHKCFYYLQTKYKDFNFADSYNYIFGKVNILQRKGELANAR